MLICPFVFPSLLMSCKFKTLALYVRIFIVVKAIVEVPVIYHAVTHNMHEQEQ